MSVGAPVLPAPVAPDPTVDFVPVFADQTEDVILARWRDWANEGLDPIANADQWVDTREGSHWFMAVMPGIRECARLYDLAGSEVPMSAFVLWAWGAYLDDLAAANGVTRLAATPALGAVLFTGPVGTELSLNTTVATVPATEDDPTPTFETTTLAVIPAAGDISVPVQATEGGVAGNVSANAITAPSTPLPAGVTFTNPAPLTGGTDVETDEALRGRVLDAMAAGGGANVAAYRRWAAAWPGVGAVKVVPTPTGPNTVLVVITDPLGAPLPAATVAALQADLDPVLGKGSGTAPVGAEVTVATSVALAIVVAVGSIAYSQGYSADGAGNTVAVQPDIEAAIKEYLATLLPGGSVRLAHIAGIIATWPGVENATGVTLNGVAADVAVGLSPPQSPQLTTPITL